MFFFVCVFFLVWRFFWSVFLLVFFSGVGVLVLPNFTIPHVSPDDTNSFDLAHFAQLTKFQTEIIHRYLPREEQPLILVTEAAPSDTEQQPADKPKPPLHRSTCNHLAILQSR